MKLSIRSANQIYHTGERLSLRGIEVIAHYSDGTKKTVTTECKYSPKSGVSLSYDKVPYSDDAIMVCGSRTGYEPLGSRSVIVTYEETNQTTNEVETASVSFPISVSDNLSEVVIVKTDDDEHFIGEDIPVRQLTIKFNGDDDRFEKSFSITDDYYKYFPNFQDGKLTTVGIIELEAIYRHEDGNEKSGFATVIVNEAYIKSIIANTAAINPVYSGQEFNYQDLSVEWFRSDYGLPGTEPSETHGIFSWDSDMIIVEPMSITDPRNRRITVRIKNQPESTSATFDLVWKPRIAGFTSMMSSNACWNNSTSSAVGLEFKTITLDNGVTVDDFGSLPSTMSVAMGLSTNEGSGMILVESDQVSSIVNVAPYVSVRYDDGLVSVLSDKTEVSAYSKATSLSIGGNPKTTYVQGTPFDPTGTEFKVFFDSGYNEYPQPERLSYNRDGLPYIGNKYTDFYIYYEQKIELEEGNDLQSSVNSLIKLNVSMRMPTQVTIKDSEEWHTGISLGDVMENERFLIGGSAIDLVLMFDDGYSTIKNLGNIDKSIEEYSLTPSKYVRQVGRYELTVTYSINDGNGNERTFEVSPFKLSVDYYPKDGNGLTLCTSPTITSYYEGQSFDPSGLSVEMRFGNGYSVDVTDDIEFLDTEIERGMTCVRAKYVLHALRGDEEYFVDIPIQTTNLLVFTPLDERSDELGVNLNPAYANPLPTSIAIPSTVDDSDASGTVVEIRERGFANLTNLAQITIPDSVIRIGDGAFMGCTSLTSTSQSEAVDLSKVEYVGQSAFYNCSNVRYVIFPQTKKLVSIGDAAFLSSGIMEIDLLSSSVSSIGVSAFGGCCNLTSIYIPATILTISNHAFAGCTALSGADILQDVIPEGCFANCDSLSDVNLSDNLKTIKTSAFYGCGMQTISIPEGLESIEDSAFENCTGMENLILFTREAYDGSMPLKNIGENAFAFSDSSNETKKVVFPRLTQSSIEDFYRKLFPNESGFARWTGNNQNIIIKGSGYVENLKYEIEPIAGEAGKAEIVSANRELLEKYTIIPSRISYDNGYGTETEYEIVKLGDFSFAGFDNIETIIIPSSVLSVGIGVFRDCENLKEVNAEDSIIKVHSVGNEAFANCRSMQNCWLVASRIGASAFYGCEELVSLSVFEVPTGQIGQDAFEGCDNLQFVTINRETPISNIFPQYESIKTAFVEVRTGDDGINLVDRLFAGCTELNSIGIANSLSAFGDFLFDGCMSLGSLGSIRPAVFTYGIDTFANSHFTQEIYMDENALYNDGILVHIPNSVADEDGEYTIPDIALSVGKFAMCRNTGIRKLIVPALPRDSEENVRLRFMDELAIYDNPELEEVEITATDIQYKDQETKAYPEQILAGNTTLSSFKSSLWNAATPYMLSGCSSLESIELLYEQETEDDALFEIGEHSFAHTGLKSVSISNENLVVVGTGAFEGGQLSAFHISSSPSYAENVFGEENNLQLVEMPFGFQNLKNAIGTNVVSVIVNVDGGSITYGDVNSILNMKALSLINCAALETNDDGGALEGLRSLSSLAFIESCPTSIGVRSFHGDESLETLFLSNVSTIGADCFGNCTRLSSIVFYGSIPTFDKTDDNDTTVFDTGGESLSILLGNKTYLNNWNNGISSKISKSLSNSVIPTAWHRENVKPNNIEIRIRDLYPQELKGSFFVFDYPLDRISIDYRDNSKPKITVYDRTNLNDFGLKIELPEPDLYNENPGIGKVELKNESTYGNIVMFEDVEDDEEEN